MAKTADIVLHGQMPTHPLRLRARFLAAMSLPLAGGGAGACSPATLPADPKDTTVLPDDTLSRYDLPGGAWSVDYAHQPVSDLPGCPDGNFCVIGSRAGADGRAPAPYEACAARVPYPHDPPPASAEPGGPAWVGGPDVNRVQDYYDIRFSESWTAHERLAENPGACCYSWFEPCPGGRPLRGEDGRAVVAPVARDAGWSGLPVDAPRDPERARRWARAAQFEHASVASFARFSLELLALGAPAALLARAHRAALDEIAHAELAFGLAASFGGEDLGPGRLPLAPESEAITPEAVARATFRDGCVAETLAALEARRDLATARTERERAALERIADDEEDHAELAFATLAWLVARFGEPVRGALAHELAHLDATTSPADDAPEHVVVAPCIRTLLAA